MAVAPRPRARKKISSAETPGVASVDRAFSILGSFTRAKPQLSLGDLAVSTGMYKSTILRLGDSLIKCGYLVRTPSGDFKVGPKPFMLGVLYTRVVRVSDVVLPLMRALHELTGESASFYAPQGNVRVCVHRIDSRREVRDHVHEGDVFPLSRGSGGGVLSAFMGVAGERYDAIRAACYYISLGERDSETAGISAPVFGAGQRLLGSLTLSGPRSRIPPGLLDTVRVPLLRAAAQATQALGGDGRVLEAAAASLPGDKSSARGR